MTYEKVVVLGRAKWTIPDEAFPRAIGMSDAEYFLHVNKWRSSHGIPAHVYAFVIPERSATPRAAVDGTMRAPIHASDSDLEFSAEDEACADADLAPDQQDMLDEAQPRSAAHPVDTKTTPSAVDASSGRKDVAQPKPSKDWGKPQFIDFTNPLLLRLFERLPGSLSKFQVTLVERFPEFADLPEHDTERFSCELVLQLNMPADCVSDAQAHDEAVRNATREHAGV
jgi:hypothetical protein